MKTKLQNIIPVLALLALATLNAQLSTVNAEGTAFTYQRRLNTNGTPVSGSFDIQFTFYAGSLINCGAQRTHISGGSADGRKPALVSV